jgi:hypothetical protein
VKSVENPVSDTLQHVEKTTSSVNPVPLVIPFDEKKSKEEEKKRKKELELNLVSINCFLFFSTLLAMFVTNMGVWFYLAY